VGVADSQAPVAGWYPDPDDASGSTWRYWDGTSWTDERYGGATGPPPVPERAGRPASLKVLIASLIALTTMLSAVGAWRAALASGDSGDAERKGFDDAIAAEQARANIEGSLDETMFAFLRGRMYESLAEGLQEEADEAARADRVRLEAQAESYRQLGELSMEFVASDAIRADGSLDLERAFDIEWALASSQADLDPAPEFAEADESHDRSEQLVGLTALLIGAAMFFTLAQVARSRAYVLYLVGGCAVLVVATGLLVAVEVS
jgi:hypothetical protein